jgi:hypothetical protein
VKPKARKRSGRKATMRDCAGCRNDFYNGKNPLGVQRCWSLDDARMCTRYRLSIHTPMDIRGAYAKVKVPQCYHVSGFIHIDEIPRYAK